MTWRRSSLGSSAPGTHGRRGGPHARASVSRKTCCSRMLPQGQRSMAVACSSRCATLRIRRAVYPLAGTARRNACPDINRGRRRGVKHFYGARSNGGQLVSRWTLRRRADSRLVPMCPVERIRPLRCGCATRAKGRARQTPAVPLRKTVGERSRTSDGSGPGGVRRRARYPPARSSALRRWGLLWRRLCSACHLPLARLDGGRPGRLRSRRSTRAAAVFTLASSNAMSPSLTTSLRFSR
jgi:hypothetical protein